jgi:hypothetical protein
LAVADRSGGQRVNVCVTGAASGIGRAIAEQFVRAGAHVAMGDIDGEAAEAAAVSFGGSALGVAVDVRDEVAFAAFLDAAQAAHGPLDVMVNNAGVIWTGPFHTQPQPASRREIEVNLVGTVIGSRLALERMLPRRKGRIVNVASGAGFAPLPGAAVYAATKHGIVGLTESLRLAYLDSGVRFTVVIPGQTATPMLTAMAPSRRIPIVRPDDVAAAVVRAVDDERFEVWVPRSGRGARLLAIVPRTVRDALLRQSGMFELGSAADPDARRAYQDRVFTR